MNFTHEEIAKHLRIGYAVCQVELGLAVLAENATILDPALAQRVLAALDKYTDARHALLSPLARALPASDARN
jgi:hypothetical protein